jgi:ribosomal protein S18 acetylase RimI-like enzyme
MVENVSWLEQVLIRPIRQTDLPAMEWDGEYTHFRRVYADAFERTRSGRTLIWLAELEGRLIGQVFVQLMNDHPDHDQLMRAYVYSFRVRAPYRRSGLGTMMMDFVEKDLAARGYNLVTLNVAQDNPDARRLYERLGYQVVGPDPGRGSYPDEKGYWRTIVEPAWRMEKKIGHSI